MTIENEAGKTGTNDEATALTQETLLAGCTVRMFGRPFAGFILDPGKLGLPRCIDDTRKPGLARISEFSWQGNYFKLGVPTIFLVYGPGTTVPRDTTGATLGTIGIEFKDEFFADDVLMWAAYDVDFSVRIDITTGWLSEVLIAPEASEASNVTGTGDGSTDGRSRVTNRISMAARHSMIARPPNS